MHLTLMKMRTKVDTVIEPNKPAKMHLNQWSIYILTWIY